MKKLIFIYFIFLLSVVYACKVVDKLTQFEIDHTSTVTIPAALGIDTPFDIFTPDIETNSESEFESNNTKKDLVEQIILKSMQLVVKSPENGDFSFLKSISVFISADGLSEKKIAWKENIPNDIGNTIDLETSDENLEAYIKKDTYKLRVNTVTDELTNTDYEVEVNATFFVDAKILGQ